MAEKEDLTINVFLSSAPEDKFLLEKLKKCLKGLKQKISVWDDSNVSPGQERISVIRAYLDTADLILLLISSDFMDSDNCEKVMLWALKRQRTSNAYVIPIILRAGDYKDAPFRDLETLPTGDTAAIASWSNPDEAFHYVAGHIREVVEELLRSKKTPDSHSNNATFPLGLKSTRLLPYAMYTSPEIVWPPPAVDNAKLRLPRCRFQASLSITLILVLLAITAVIVLAHAYPPSAVVTITPNNKALNGTYSITAVTGVPNSLQHQVQARQLSYTTPPQSTTVNATGIVQNPGVQATGILTFYNGMTIPQVVLAGTHFPSANGIQIVNDVAVTIPAANPPTEGQTTVTAHAANTGLNGNIVALDINMECCTSNHTIVVKNFLPFTGGKDPLNYTFVQQSDIDGAANSLAQPLAPSAQSSLQLQIYLYEKTIAKPGCTNKVSSNHNAGDRVDKVDVSVAVTCTAEVYDSPAVESVATNLLKQDATQNLGTAYTVVGNTIKITVIQAKVTDAKGTVSLQVKAEGLYAYQFDATQKQKLSKLIVGKTQQDATKILKQQTGVMDVRIDAGIGNLPTNPANISIEIATPSEKTKT